MAQYKAAVKENPNYFPRIIRHYSESKSGGGIYSAIFIET
jgi:hypothetical protein